MTFAQQGNLDDMQLARDRLRAVSGGASGANGSAGVEPATLLAMLQAYASAGGHAYAPQAAEVLGELQGHPAYASSSPEGARLRSEAKAAMRSLKLADGASGTGAAGAAAGASSAIVVNGAPRGASSLSAAGGADLPFDQQQRGSGWNDSNSSSGRSSRRGGGGRGRDGELR